ncbi:MAG TPA: Uma2 family endonuclease, partial [Phycisphaerae bacterium]
MLLRPRLGDITFAEFMETVREDEKADLIDGVIYMASPENSEHNDLVLWLATILRVFMEERDLGRVTMSRVAYRLGVKGGPEPDVAVVLKARSARIKRGYVEGRPDLAIEVVSPDSVARDYHLKWKQYERARVPEYWIIDPEERQTTFLRYERGRFVKAAVRDHIFRSRILSGFQL